MKSFAIFALVASVSAIQIRENTPPQYIKPSANKYDYYYKPGYNADNYKASDGGPYVPYYMNHVSNKQWMTTDGGHVVGLQGMHGFRDDSTGEPIS